MIKKKYKNVTILIDASSIFIFIVALTTVALIISIIGASINSQVNGAVRSERYNILDQCISLDIGAYKCRQIIMIEEDQD